MATSGTTTFNLDLTEISEEAYERAGTEMRSGYDLRTARRSLNLLFADWANRGVNMWTFEQDVITLVTGQPTYALPDDTVDILDHVIRTGANSANSQADLSITRIAMPTYATIPNKLIRARPIQVWVQRLAGTSSVLPGTLNAAITAADTTIPITTTRGLPNAGFVQIGSELIVYNQYTAETSTTPGYLLNCVRGQQGTTAASALAGAALSLVQKNSITVWPVPENGSYQFVYWRMRRVQDAGNGVNTFDVPFRFVPALVAGLAYYLCLKVPNGLDRLQVLKAQYDEAWQMAADQDRETASTRLVPRMMTVGGR